MDIIFCYLISFFIFRFVKRQLHGGPPEPINMDSLKQEIQELRSRTQQLEEENELLKSQVTIIIIIISTHNLLHVL